MADEQQATRDEFGRSVNMTRKELADWLDTDESKAAGQHPDGGESTGQRPDKADDELAGMTWTHSLKNWGHDPLKG